MTVTDFALREEDLAMIVEQIWQTFNDAGEMEPAPVSDPSDWTAVVTIAGAWAGSVAIALTEVAAVRISRAMLALDESDPVTEEDISDAVGEVINMGVGSVKSLADGHSGLSIPVVATGHLVTPHDATEMCRIDRDVEGEHVAVTVHIYAAGSFEGGAS